jgi:DNA (cytosine-5)-methyltransferase 1
MGFHRAGLRVVGVDIDPQPRYPFRFVQADALALLRDMLKDRPLALYIDDEIFPVDAIHISPPCQDHIRGGLQNSHGTGWMLAAARELLEEARVPWVIENVPGAPMRPDYILCGSHFGLTVRRHRWFETSWRGYSLMAACDHSTPVVGVYGHPHGRAGAWPGMLPGTIENWRTAMDIDWMDAEGLREAVPPAYGEYIGAALLDHLAAVTT